MITLLDINVLVSLPWPNHVHHAAGRQWFIQNRGAGELADQNDASVVQLGL